VWQAYADDVRDQAFDCGHFLAEEEPERTAAALAAFFGHV
jgi:haloacetate dehalogenase